MVASSDEIVVQLTDAIHEHRVLPGMKLSEDDVGDIYQAGEDAQFFYFPPIDPATTSAGSSAHQDERTSHVCCHADSAGCRLPFPVVSAPRRSVGPVPKESRHQDMTLGLAICIRTTTSLW